MGVELVRYVYAEVRAGHFGTFGFHFHQFLADELLAERYGPKKRRLIARFVADMAEKYHDAHALSIARGALADR